VSVAGTRFDQSKPFVCTDDNNGFYCSFENLAEGVKQIRLQQVSSDGVLRCDQAGALVSASSVDQQDAQIAPDGQGGCYVVWSGFDPSFQLDVYVMRMGRGCEPLWSSPVLVSNNVTVDDVLQGIAADGNGCVWAVWQTGDFGAYDILGAKVCGDGTVAWQGAVSSSPREQTEASIVADGEGGVYVAWSDTRNQLDAKDVYAQKLNASGEPQWTNNGMLVVNHPLDQKIPRMAVDSQHNVFVVWQDFRSAANPGGNLDLYGQKLSAAGTRLWTPLSGKPFCVQPGDQSDQQLLVEWGDGLYVAWEDGRANPYSDIYGVHLTPGSTIPDPHWGTMSDTEANGGSMVSEYQNQNQPALAHDYHGGTMGVWVDWRSSGKEPLQNIWGNWLNDFTVGVRELPTPLPREYMLTQNYPNPFNPSTEFRFTIPATEDVKIAVFNTLGQEVQTLIDEVMHAGTYEVTFDASALSSGVYFYRLETPSFQTVKKMQLVR